MKSPKVLTKSQNTPPTECVSTLVGSRTPAADYSMLPEDYEIETINDAKWIPLTQGLFALVDKCDYEDLIKNTWTLLRGKYTNYAYRAIRLRNPDETIHIAMHRQILNAPGGMYVDHKFHNGLDNRRCNIRLCTKSQNAQNSRPQKREDATSRFKGVHIPMQYKKYMRGKMWEAKIILNGKNIYIGQYESEIEAAKAYDEKALELYGEFAYTNFQFLF